MSDSSDESGILAGVRVVELAAYIFAPAAATVLSDFGADVVKIEQPGVGDPYRYLGRIPPLPECPNPDYLWLLDARNKRSVALDLKVPEAIDVVRRLVATADVFLTNFRPAALARMRLEYADLRAINDRLIYARASGYGETGPDADRPGYDITAYWARSGLMDGVSTPESEPCLAPAGAGDHPSAMALAAAILLALYRRERTGRGSKVSASLMATGAWANSCMIQSALCGADVFRQLPRSRVFNPLVNHYLSRDGARFLLCGLRGEEEWARLCRAIERPDLAQNPDFAGQDARRDRAERLIAILDGVFRERDMADWRERFRQNDVPWSPVPTNVDVARDEHFAANGVFVEMRQPDGSTVRVVDSPIRVEGSPKTEPRYPPAIGQHTRDVLLEAGYAPGEIDRLARLGALGTPPA
jgi:crotonobetainyl-CoA:carnitine CoA-transferase CaiB-like acyl-CoA transferase